MRTNIYKLKNVIRQYGFFYLLGVLMIFGIKYFYSRAGSDELIWILAPTTKWVSILSGIPFTYESGIGYVNHSLRYLIAPSCSGVQFLIITMATLIFSFVHRVGALGGEAPEHPSRRFKRCLGFTIASTFSSYVLTIFVNGLRIIVAIYLPQYLGEWNLTNAFLTPDRLHTIIGTAVYFISLLTIYRLAESIFRTQQNRKWSPIFWYFFIVLGIPFLNRANRKDAQFTEYTLLIIAVCMTILLLYRLGLLIRRFSSHET